MRYPTPEGVPVVRMLPAWIVVPWLQCAMSSGTEKIICFVLLFWRSSASRLIRVSNVSE